MATKRGLHHFREAPEVGCSLLAEAGWEEVMQLNDLKIGTRDVLIVVDMQRLSHMLPFGVKGKLSLLELCFVFFSGDLSSHMAVVNGIPFWLVGEFTTHFRAYFSGWIGMFTGGTFLDLTHNHMWLCVKIKPRENGPQV